MADNRPKKILVAEDTDSNFLLVSIILRKEYTVLRAYNGIEAIDVYKKEQPDLILMDIKMPEMDGLEASRAIRDIDPEIPIIALTANAFDSDKQKAIDAGCNDYMAKPIVVGQLTAMIKKYISADFPDVIGRVCDQARFAFSHAPEPDPRFFRK